jgi:hypothetical protein
MVYPGKMNAIIGKMSDIIAKIRYLPLIILHNEQNGAMTAF